MTHNELIDQQCDLLRDKLKATGSNLIIAIAADPDRNTAPYWQLVGVGVSIELLRDAMTTSLRMLELEVRNRNRGS